jgi:hypothetical protein
MQQYRIEGGKLAETWVSLLKLGSAWPDTAGQGALDEQAAMTKRAGHKSGRFYQ